MTIRVTLMALVAGAATAAAVATAASQDTPTEATVAESASDAALASPPSTPPETMPTALRDAYRALRRDRVAEDRMPGALAHDVTAGALAAPCPQLARLALSSDALHVYAVPAQHHLCIASLLGSGKNANSAGSCTQTKTAVTKGVFTARYCVDPARPGYVFVVGLAPDGVKRVELRRDGATLATSRSRERVRCGGPAPG